MKKKTDIQRAALILGFLLIPILALSAWPFSRQSHGSNYTMPEGWDISELQLIDGTYTGMADGFGPDLTVEIVIEDGELVSIEVIDHNEVNRQFWQRPVDLIPEAIIEAGETEVDAVSGATATSKGIMAAVENALEKALRD